MPRLRLVLGCALVPLLLASPTRPEGLPPILDMHLHAMAADAQGPPPLTVCTPFPEFPAWDPARPYGEAFTKLLKEPHCPDPMRSPLTDEEVRARTVQVMERHNVYGVLSGSPDRVATWMAAAPGRFIAGRELTFGPGTASPEQLRAEHAAGGFAVLAEITNQYAGIAPDDPRMEPYWALAEELDIPVGIHVGPGPPGAPYLGFTGYRARLHSALTLEEVLLRHPRLRVYIMHAGYPMLDDLLAVLYAHPQVYVDVGVIVFSQPRAAFYRYLRGIVEAGFGQRVLYGTDQMVWPEAIERGIAVIEEAPFLTSEQKRDIFYGNAARFLRLGEEERARHRGR
jgi:hypothetical protein